MSDSKCTVCSKFRVDLRPLASGGFTCGICRALDRVRGVCLRLPEGADENILALISSLEGKLRDLRHFGGSLPQDSSSTSKPPAGERWSDVCRVSSKATPKEPREPPPRNPGSSSDPRRHSAPESSWGTGKKRKKSNKGHSRRTWQDTRVKVAKGRNFDCEGEGFDWSNSESEIE